MDDFSIFSCSGLNLAHVRLGGVFLVSFIVRVSDLLPLPTLPRAPWRCAVRESERVQVPQRALWLPLGCFGRGLGRLCAVFSASFSFSFANSSKKHAILSSEAIFLPIFIKKQVPSTWKNLKNHWKTKVFQWFFQIQFFYDFSSSSSFWERFLLKNASTSPHLAPKDFLKCPKRRPRGPLEAPGSSPRAHSGSLGTSWGPSGPSRVPLGEAFSRFGRPEANLFLILAVKDLQKTMET